MSLRRGAQAEHSFSNRRWRVRGAIARRDRGAGCICGTAGLSAPLPPVAIDRRDPAQSESAPLPTEPSAQIAISTALGRVMSDSSIARGLKYLDRMPAEMRVMASR